MATSTNNNDTMDFDDDGNIVPAVQINITQQRDNRPPAIQVLETAELVNHIVRYLPATSYPACSLINRIWREAILFSSLTYKATLLSTQQWIESTPRRIYILSAYILQYSAAVDTGLPPGGASSNQFVFSCQTRSGSVDSYGSSGSNSDQKSGASSGHTRTSGESSGSASHLQRHHTHQPGHDVEPFHSFHTYQSSAIVPNVYFKTSIQLPPHLSSPPPLPPLPIAQQINYTFSSSPPTSQQQSLSQGGPSIPPSSPQPHQQQPHQHHQTTTGFLPGQHVSTMDARPTIDQLLGYPLPLPTSSQLPDSSTDTELSSSDLHHYEADISTDSNRSSMMVVDVADMSLSPGQILLPPHGLSTFPTPDSSSSTPRQQQYRPQQQQHQQSIPSSSSSTPIPMRHHEQQYQQQQPTVRVVPCPYELPTEGTMQYEENLVMVKKGSRTSTESTHSHDSTVSTSSSCSSSGESHHGISDPSSSSVSVLQGGAYTPYASPIMEESSNPSVFGSPYTVVGAGGGGGGGGGVRSSSGARVGSAWRGSGGQGQGSSSPASARMSGKELAPEYQRTLALREHNQQLQQLQHQGGRRNEMSPRDDIPMTHIVDRGDVRMDTTSSGEMNDQTDLGRRSSANTNSPPSYRTSSASLPVHHQQQQHHHHHHHSHRHHDQGGSHSAIDSSSAPISTSTSSSSGGTNSHHHSHHHSHRHQQRQQRARQQQQQQQQQKHHQNQPPNNTRPSRNWSMAVQTFYYQNSALNAMIVACREHMLSPEGQGGAIVEKTDTSRIIWNESTRQEHIWTITPTLMDRTNPDFVEADFDPELDYA